MTDSEIKQRNKKLAPITSLLAQYDQRLSRKHYEECCAYAGIEPSADEEIRQGECGLTREPYTYSEDLTGAGEIRRRIDRARLRAMNMAE
jgi:hypothetical protein